MVARKFIVNHRDSDYDIDYDTDDGLEVLKFQLFSLTSIPPDDQKIFGGGNDLVLEDCDLSSVSSNLRLVSVNDEVDEKIVLSGSSSSVQTAELLQSDEEFARMLQAEEEALMMQRFVARESKGEMESRLRPYIDQVLMYEDPRRQEEARKTVPVDELDEKAAVTLAKEGNFTPSKSEQDHAFLLQLLYWFKQSFRWVNAPPCDGCNGETVVQGMGSALPSELRYGASRVEIYRCTLCSRVTRFPRYNDPSKLVETRKGRCGEWANCFTFYCRAFGYESRLIMDFNDHVWTECFSHHLGRWMHLDCCEAVYDRPLLYEKGWNKKLNYVIAIAIDGVFDVTKRYTRKWVEVLSRRQITTEPVLTTLLTSMTKKCRKGFSPEVLSVLEDRDRTEVEAIEQDYLSKEDDSISLPGRQSGDKEWRISRAEFCLTKDTSLCSASCPVRICIDEHVTKIYNAFAPIVSVFVNSSLPKSRAIEVLEFVKSILTDLRNSPFKNRRAYIENASNESKFFVDQMLPSFKELLEALYLEYSSVTEGRIEICLAGDPTRTSLGLPVVLDAINETIRNLIKCDYLKKKIVSFPVLKLNRICSGAVLASGEEVPIGIATSAFDGSCLTKWEEPNGGRGCWIIYKVRENKLHELVAYELMSANDAPERDPMDWVVEGSEDGGANWCVLDKQTSQKFEKRFERQTYAIRSDSLQKSNAFRFRFLAVRDIQATSRLQIGAIDLYATNN